MNFDLYEFLKYHNGSKFYPVKVEEIDELEKKLNLIVPKELKDLLLGIGYGFIKGSENNVNRIMDTDSIRDFRLRKGDFEFYPDIEIYDEYEDGKLIFFEGSDSALISIELTDDNKSNIFYYDVKIADSLKDYFLHLCERAEEKEVLEKSPKIISVRYSDEFLAIIQKWKNKNTSNKES